MLRPSQPQAVAVEAETGQVAPQQPQPQPGFVRFEVELIQQDEVLGKLARFVVGRHSGDHRLEIVQGLETGQRVVVAGMSRISDGMKVTLYAGVKP